MSYHSDLHAVGAQADNLWTSLREAEKRIEKLESTLLIVTGKLIHMGYGFLPEVDCAMELLKGTPHETRLPETNS